jgi:hypothetical protein
VGKPVFHLEAKSHKVNIITDINSAFQVKTYGYSSDHPISVLTNFKELAIYNTYIKPVDKQQAYTNRVDYFKCTEYIERFDELWDLFAYENVQNDSITQYAKRKKIISETPVKGQYSVGDSFLADIEI